jgi:hypothetical protein
MLEHGIYKDLWFTVEKTKLMKDWKYNNPSECLNDGNMEDLQHGGSQ